MRARFLSLLCCLPLTVAVACSGDTETPDAGMANADATSSAADSGMTGADAGEMDGQAGGMDAEAMEDAGSGIDPAQEPYRTLHDRGTPETRIDIVIVGDGYTQEELDSVYDEHVDKLAGAMFERRSNRRDVTQPFRNYRNYFNVHRVHLASNESGIDEGATERDTALDGNSTCNIGVGGGPCWVNADKVYDAIDAALAGSGIVPDWRIVVLNTEEKAAGIIEDPRGNIAVYPGGFGGNAVHLPRMLALREIAKAFANVEYEFGGTLMPYAGPEFAAANVTTDSTGAKWAHWMGFDDDEDNVSAIGVYEGAAGYDNGVFRPTEVSKMGPIDNGNTYRFNVVAREAIIMSMYQQLTLVLDQEANDMTLTDPTVLWLQPLDRDRLDIEWTVDGRVAEGQTDPALGITDWARLNGLGAGTYTVTARVFDDTSWVRAMPRTGLEASVSWTVELTGN